MPNQADLVVKKNDGATNITWSKVSPSSGDKSPALWISNSVGTATAHRPRLTVASRSNGPGTARRVDVNGVYPSLVTGTDGITRISDRATFTASFLVPDGMKDQDVWEATAQFINCLADTNIRDSVRSGYAPT